MNCTVFVPVPWEKASFPMLTELLGHARFTWTFVTKDQTQGVRVRF